MGLNARRIPAPTIQKLRLGSRFHETIYDLIDGQGTLIPTQGVLKVPGRPVRKAFRGQLTSDTLNGFIDS